MIGLYNRYIPAAGGGHVCHPVSELPELERSGANPHAFRAQGPTDHPHSPPPPRGSGRGLGFLEKLLPRSLETDDLLILLILLLLMMDSDGGDDSLTVLLAVAAFLILQ